MLRLERLEAGTLVPVLAHAKPSVANLQRLDMERSLERQYAPILGSKFLNTWYKRSLLLYTQRPGSPPSIVNSVTLETATVKSVLCILRLCPLIVTLPFPAFSEDFHLRVCKPYQ